MLKAMGDLPDHLRRSITWDRGSEMAGWQDISLQLHHVYVYFCDPHSPWQRGTNENTNRLLRFWFEKAPTSAATPPTTSKPSPTNSTPDPDPPSIWDTPAQRMAQLLSQAA